MGNVVQFRAATVPPSLRLREIVGRNGVGVITGWLQDVPGSRARLRVRVNDMRRVPRADWNKKQFRHIGNGLYEIKWKWSDKEWRAIGFDRAGFFVLVIGCTHKQKVYTPTNCLETAARRKAETERGERSVIDYEP